MSAAAEASALACDLAFGRRRVPEMSAVIQAYLRDPAPLPQGEHGVLLARGSTEQGALGQPEIHEWEIVRFRAGGKTAPLSVLHDVYNLRLHSRPRHRWPIVCATDLGDPDPVSLVFFWDDNGNSGWTGMESAARSLLVEADGQHVWQVEGGYRPTHRYRMERRCLTPHHHPVHVGATHRVLDGVCGEMHQFTIEDASCEVHDMCWEHESPRPSVFLLGHETDDPSDGASSVVVRWQMGFPKAELLYVHVDDTLMSLAVLPGTSNLLLLARSAIFVLTPHTARVERLVELHGEYGGHSLMVDAEHSRALFNGVEFFRDREDRCQRTTSFSPRVVPLPPHVFPKPSCAPACECMREPWAAAARDRRNERRAPAPPPDRRTRFKKPPKAPPKPPREPAKTPKQPPGQPAPAAAAPSALPPTRSLRRAPAPPRAARR